ncbi:MAG: hypothetical protein WCY11_11880 [Novosphingobium sp.]
MIMLLNAVALAAAAPVAAPPAHSGHSSHHAPSSEQGSKECCCKANEMNADRKRMKSGDKQGRETAPAQHSQHNHVAA